MCRLSEVTAGVYTTPLSHAYIFCLHQPPLVIFLIYTLQSSVSDVYTHLMPYYCLQDCHYFFRTALKGLAISTFVSPLHA